MNLTISKVIIAIAAAATIASADQLHLAEDLVRAQTILSGIPEIAASDVEYIRSLVDINASLSLDPSETPRPMTSTAIEAIFRNAELLSLITKKELKLGNIVVTDQVDISNAKVGVPILLTNCRFLGGMKARNCQLVALVMKNCKLGGFEGDGLIILNDLVIGPATEVKSEFRLPNCSIGGGLRVEAGSLLAHGPLRDCSINLTDAKIKGEVYIGSKSKTTTLSGCMIINGSNLGRLKLENVYLSRNESEDQGYALLANWADIRGSVEIGWGSQILGALNLQGTKIGGTFFAEDISIDSQKCALILEDARLETSMFLRHVNLKGTDEAARLTRLQLKGNLEIEASTLRGEWRSVNAEGLTGGGLILLKNNDMSGETRFSGVHIRGDISVESGAYSFGSKSATQCFSLDGADIGGSVIFTKNPDDQPAIGVSCNGILTLRGARIGADLLLCSGGLGKAFLDLRQANVNRFIPLPNSWPGKLRLDGFTYQRIRFDDDEKFWNKEEANPPRKQSRTLARHLTDNSRALLERATEGNRTFEPQPYEQLAGTMRAMGHHSVAHEILTAMSENRMKFPDWSPSEALWYKFFGKAIGYGYNPSRAFLLSIIWIWIAALIFWVSKKRQWLKDSSEVDPVIINHIPTRWTAEKLQELAAASAMVKPDRSRFLIHALPYSIEKFVPLLNAELSEKWEPSDIFPGRDNRGAIFIRGFIWIHKLIGLVLASLWIGALTGLAK